MATETTEPEDVGDAAKEMLDDVAGEGTANKMMGDFKEAGGEVKSTLGQALDDGGLQGEGAAEKLEGKAQHAAGEAEGIGEKIADFVGDAKDAVGGFFNKVKDALDGDDDEPKA